MLDVSNNIEKCICYKRLEHWNLPLISTLSCVTVFLTFYVIAPNSEHVHVRIWSYIKQQDLHKTYLSLLFRLSVHYFCYLLFVFLGLFCKMYMSEKPRYWQDICFYISSQIYQCSFRISMFTRLLENSSEIEIEYFAFWSKTQHLFPLINVADFHHAFASKAFKTSWKLSRWSKSYTNV